jgi:predicted enzyme related to lactoylglutathione lyase
MNIQGADFFAYLVSDLKRSDTIYRDVLGLPQTEYKEEWQWAEFDCGNITLTLYAGIPLPDVVWGGRIALSLEDIHEAHQVLKEKGAEILKPPYELSGCWHLEILDPDPNMIIIHHRKTEQPDDLRDLLPHRLLSAEKYG